MRHLQRVWCVAAVAAVVFATASPISAQSGHNLERPAYWKVHFNDSDGTRERRFVVMRPGWHVFAGPGVFFWDPGSFASGSYAVSSTIFLFPEGEPEQSGSTRPGGRRREAAAAQSGGRGEGPSGLEASDAQRREGKRCPTGASGVECAQPPALRPGANPGGAMRATREPVRAPVSGRTDGTAPGVDPLMPPTSRRAPPTSPRYSDASRSPSCSRLARLWTGRKSSMWGRAATIPRVRGS